MARYVVYGGTFDPVTYHHLLTAEIVRVRRKIDKVFFIPCTDIRTDKHRDITKNEHRLAMLKLAIEDNEYFEVEDIEMRMPGWNSYTYFTMKYLKEKYPNDEIYFLMGADNLASLSSWKYGKELIQENKFIVISRDNYDMLEIIAKDPILRKYEDHFDLLHKGIRMDNSSTFVREEIKMGGSARYLLPEKCLKYALEHGLYK